MDWKNEALNQSSSQIYWKSTHLNSPLDEINGLLLINILLFILRLYLNKIIQEYEIRAINCFYPQSGGLSDKDIAWDTRM